VNSGRTVASSRRPASRDTVLSLSNGRHRAERQKSVPSETRLPFSTTGMTFSPMLTYWTQTSSVSGSFTDSNPVAISRRVIATSPLSNPRLKTPRSCSRPSALVSVNELIKIASLSAGNSMYGGCQFQLLPGLARSSGLATLRETVQADAEYYRSVCKSSHVGSQGCVRSDVQTVPNATIALLARSSRTTKYQIDNSTTSISSEYPSLV